MNHFELLKLAMDVMLVLSLLFLCVRFVRTGSAGINTRELRDLEIVLRTLLKDADTASHSLNDSLSRRQQSLERLLVDIESTERRVNGSILTIESQISTASRRAAQISGGAQPSYQGNSPIEGMEADGPWSEPPSFEQPYAPPQRQSGARTQSRAPEQRVAQAYAATAASRPAATQKATRAQKFNIYGEPITNDSAAMTAPQSETAASYVDRSSERSSPMQSSESNRMIENRSRVTSGSNLEMKSPLPRQPLASSIEVERDDNSEETVTPPTSSETAQLERVYEAAEQMIREGHALNQVVARTSLPMEEVQALSRLMAREESRRNVMPRSELAKAVEVVATAAEAQIAVTTPSAPSRATNSATEMSAQSRVETEMEMPSEQSRAEDPRLGVLGKMRRQTQVL